MKSAKDLASLIRNRASASVRLVVADHRRNAWNYDVDERGDLTVDDRYPSPHHETLTYKGHLRRRDNGSVSGLCLSAL